MKAAKAMGPLEKAAKDSAGTLLTSKIAVAVLDTWGEKESKEFLGLYLHSQWSAMYGMLTPFAEECSVRTATDVCNIIAEILEEKVLS